MEGKALVCVDPKGPLQVMPLVLPDLGPEDVEVKVSSCVHFEVPSFTLLCLTGFVLWCMRH